MTVCSKGGFGLNKNALLTVSGEKTTFRFHGVARQELYSLLSLFRSHFPQMKWDQELRAWTLPSPHFQQLYELCRTQFGPTGIHISVEDYRAKAPGLQPPLFGNIFNN